MNPLLNRVAKLERLAQRFDPSDCPGLATAWYVEGEPRPVNPPRCRQCGDPHVLVIVEEIVPPHDDADDPIEAPA